MLGLVLSCEHASNYIPEAYSSLFLPYQELLTTHEGWDIGALTIAQQFSKTFDVPLYASTISRLLVDLNRSIYLNKPFSKISQHFSVSDKANILDHYYYPYRQIVQEKITKLLEERRPILHLSVHTFTPNLNGVERKCDVGLLYDPARQYEKSFCLHWRNAIIDLFAAKLKCRLNYPYKGISDGLVRHLRSVFPADAYLGIELEVNQKFFLDPDSRLPFLEESLIKSFERALDSYCHSAT